MSDFYDAFNGTTLEQRILKLALALLHDALDADRYGSEREEKIRTAISIINILVGEENGDQVD